MARTIFEIGDKIKFTSFAYQNKAGGTGLAGPKENETMGMKFTGIGSGVVKKAWEDYECGWRYVVTPDEDTWNIIKDVAGKKEVYVSEFETTE